MAPAMTQPPLRPEPLCYATPRTPSQPARPAVVISILMGLFLLTLGSALTVALIVGTFQWIVGGEDPVNPWGLLLIPFNAAFLLGRVYRDSRRRPRAAPPAAAVRETLGQDAQATSSRRQQNPPLPPRRVP